MDKLIIDSLDNIDDIARKFLKQYGRHRIIAFYGSMGAGKTTFIKALCKAMGVEDEVNSPSFAIVNEYHTPDDDTIIYHFDFYRLKSVEEALDIGYEEYVFSGNYCFMEWPEKIEPILPEERLDVLIEENEDGTRSVIAKEANGN
jgi:tRNA threonylcarbamoyladenosine biosynthesis protein TsaE